jgi:hypothetical protein
MRKILALGMILLLVSVTCTSVHSLKEEETNGLYIKTICSKIIDKHDSKLQSYDSYTFEEDSYYSVYCVNPVKKILKHSVLPVSTKKDTVVLYAAKNEYEPFQLVIKSSVELKDVEITIGDLVNADDGYVISADQIDVAEAYYVKITNLTDRSDKPFHAYIPDPLPSYQPQVVEPHVNHPIWITIYVPKDATAGRYQGEILIKPSNAPETTVDLILNVWDFALPDVSHLRTTYGLGYGSIKRYHNLSDEQMEVVVEKYLENFRSHRISPGPAYPYKINVTFENGEFRFNFTDFDKALHRHLDVFGFNSYPIPFPGIRKGGSFYGYQEGTEEYNKTMIQYIKGIADHLEEKGWLSKGFWYIWDEPNPEVDPGIYDFISYHASLAKQANKNIKILLTCYFDKQFLNREELFDYIDIWVPVESKAYPHLVKKRQMAGDEVWWYVCTGPRWPYPNYFIDHRAIEHRVRFWMAWKYNINGDLYWATTYWAQNPWEHPMSVAGTGYKWGNGDGRLIYPPDKEGISKEPNLNGPVNSIRWELIREGLEDYEYFWLLKEWIKIVKALDNPDYNDEIEEGEKALAEIDGMIKHLIIYPRLDSTWMYKIRSRIANAIVALQKCTR